MRPSIAVAILSSACVAGVAGADGSDIERHVQGASSDIISVLGMLMGPGIWIAIAMALVITVYGFAASKPHMIFTGVGSLLLAAVLKTMLGTILTAEPRSTGPMLAAADAAPADAAPAVVSTPASASTPEPVAMPVATNKADHVEPETVDAVGIGFSQDGEVKALIPRAVEAPDTGGITFGQ